MKEKLFSNIVFLLIVNLLVKPLWVLGIEATVHNRLGSEVMGHFVSLLNLSIIYQIILDLGLNTYNTNTISREPNQANQLFPSVLIAKALLGLVYLGVIMTMGSLLGLSMASLLLLALLGVTQLLNSVFLFIRSTVVGLQHFRTDSYLSILDKGFMILVCGYLLFIADSTFTIEQFVYAQVVSYAASVIIGYIYIHQKIKISFQKDHLLKILPVLKQGFPYAVLIFVMSIYFKADVVILEHLTKTVQPDAAGIYFAKYRFLDIANNMTGVLIAGFLLPFFAKHIKDNQVIRSTSMGIMQVLFTMSILVVVISFFYGDGLLRLVYTNPVNQEGFLLFLVMLSFPFYCMNYVFSTLLTAYKALRWLVIINLIAAIICVMANVILIPTYGPYATAIIAVVVHGTVALINYWYARRLYGFNYDAVQSFKNFLWLLLLVGLGYALGKVSVGLWLGIACMVAFAVIAALALRIINIKKIIANFK